MALRERAPRWPQCPAEYHLWDRHTRPAPRIRRRGGRRRRRRARTSPSSSRGAGSRELGANWPANDTAVVNTGSSDPHHHTFLMWHAERLAITALRPPTTDLPRLTYRIQPRQPCHMFEVVTPSRRITNIQRLIGEMVGLQNTSRVDPLQRYTRMHTTTLSRTAWFELAPGSPAILSPSAYTTYTIFPRLYNKRMSPGSDAKRPVRTRPILVGLFLTLPEWRRSRVVYISPSPEVPRPSWLPTPRRITLVVGTVLPTA
jgi:hypothetical protein